MQVVLLLLMAAEAAHLPSALLLRHRAEAEAAVVSIPVVGEQQVGEREEHKTLLPPTVATVSQVAAVAEMELAVGVVVGVVCTVLRAALRLRTPVVGVAALVEPPLEPVAVQVFASLLGRNK